MKILACHNHYQQPGGEDRCFAAEISLLESKGHEVVPFTMHNDDIQQMSSWQVARRTFWNNDSYRQLRELMRIERPAIMHCTNTFPLISPAACHAAQAEGIPVVQSLHNYRLLCANSLFLRENKSCEDCLGTRTLWPALLHGCYRGSRSATGVVAGMIMAHRHLKTWTRKVDQFIALSEFSRQLFIKGGLPSSKIAVKPNFVDPDPGVASGGGGYAVFVGRLSEEKGVATMLDAWAQMERQVPLKILGDGPLGDRVRAATEHCDDIEWLGRVSNEEALRIVGDAEFLVLPSICYENFPLTIVEAFSKGTPVIAPRLGAMAELVDDARTGLHFAAGDSADLARKVQRLFRDPRQRETMRAGARRQYERYYTAEANYVALMAIYRRAATAHAAAYGTKQIPVTHDPAIHGRQTTWGAQAPPALK